MSRHVTCTTSEFGLIPLDHIDHIHTLQRMQANLKICIFYYDDIFILYYLPYFKFAENMIWKQSAKKKKFMYAGLFLLMSTLHPIINNLHRYWSYKSAGDQYQ